MRFFNIARNCILYSGRWGAIVTGTNFLVGSGIIINRHRVTNEEHFFLRTAEPTLDLVGLGVSSTIKGMIYGVLSPISVPTTVYRSYLTVKERDLRWMGPIFHPFWLDVDDDKHYCFFFKLKSWERTYWDHEEKKWYH